MSKLMKDLNHLNTIRKNQGGVIIKDGQDGKEQAKPSRDYQGIYFLGFLIVILIVISAVSMSASVKTFAELERSWADSTAIVKMLNSQGRDVRELQSMLAKSNAQRSGQLEALQGQVTKLTDVIAGREKGIADTTVAFNEFKAAASDTIEELKLSDQILLKKYFQLNDKLDELSMTGSGSPISY